MLEYTLGGKDISEVLSMSVTAVLASWIFDCTSVQASATD